jgi:hypothetical protein
MQTEIVIPEPIICNNVVECLNINLDYLSEQAIHTIRNYYKNDTILIQYAIEIVKHDGYGIDGPEIEIRTLNIIIHDRFEFNTNTNLYNPIYRYDTFTCEYIISCEPIPEYSIDRDETKYSNIIDDNLFS